MKAYRRERWGQQRPRQKQRYLRPSLFLAAEVLAVLMLVLAISLYRWFGVALVQPVDLYLLQLKSAFYYYLSVLLVTYIFILVSMGWRAKRCRQKLSETAVWHRFSSLFLNLWDIVTDWRFINCFIVTITFFNELKGLTPLINPRLFDAELLAAERALFGGYLLSDWMIRLLGSQLAVFFSFWYSGFYAYFTLLGFLMVLQRDRRLAAEFFAPSICSGCWGSP